MIIYCINYKEPYINYYQMKTINKQFRKVHKLNLDNSFIKEINKLLLNRYRIFISKYISHNVWVLIKLDI